MEIPPTSDSIAMEAPTEATGRHVQLTSASSTRVNVHCNACQAYMGIFENEWIRLTSSYARPAQQGIHHGTDIRDKTRVVPTGTGQRSAEGCTLSDVVCQKCSAIVGQYCREAPTVEQHYLENRYFYKLSKVTLKNSNLESVDPVFAYGEDVTPEAPGSPVPSVVAPDPKWSHPPPIKGHFRNVHYSDGMMPPPPRSSRTPAIVRDSRAPRSSSRPQWSQSHAARGTSSVRGSSASSHRQADSVRRSFAETTEGVLALRRVLEQDVELTKMNSLMENIQREMRALREATGSSNQGIVATNRSQAENEEMQALRAENYALKKVIKTLPAQTQFEDPRHSHGYDDPFGTPESNSTNALGKRKRNSYFADDSIFYDDGDITGSYDDFDDPMNEASGLATLERDANQEGYSIWQGDQDGSDGADLSEDNDVNQDSGFVDVDMVHSDEGIGQRHSARSKERRQTLPADFIAEEQRYLLSDSNDENFDPNDPKVKGRKHKRTRSAERRRRERLERQQDSLWKKGVPGGGYENGDGWVEQKRHHSGRFGRKAAVGDGPAVYPKYVNDKLFANGRQIPTTHKRLARELVYLGLDDWIDKDKSDALYRRTIRVARKHYAYHHGGISSKALCQGKYTRKDLELVGMWDDELFEEINMGEESDVDKLDFPLDPALQKSIEKWKKEAATAKERKKAAEATAGAAIEAAEVGNEPKDSNKATDSNAKTNDTNTQSQILDLTQMTEFSDEDGGAQEPGQHSVPQVPDRIERHTKFDSIWQASVSASDNPLLSIVQHAEARIRAAEEEMGEPTFQSKRAQKPKTIDKSSNGFSRIISQVSKDAYITPVNDKANKAKRQKAPSAGTIWIAGKKNPKEMMTASANSIFELENSDEVIVPVVNTCKVNEKGSRGASMRTVSEHLDLLGLRGKKESSSFLRELRAYFAVDKDTGARLSVQQHIALTDAQLMEYAEKFLETSVVLVGGSRKIGFEYWRDDGSTKLGYSADKEEIKKHVYDIFVIQRFNKARNLRLQLNKTLGETLSMAQVLNPASTRPGDPKDMPPFSQAVAKSRSQSSLPERPFENGLRYEVKPGFCGNKYYYEDGTPRTAEDAARLERKLKYKNRNRASLPVDGLSDDQVIAQDQVRRRATMLGLSTSNDVTTDSVLMTSFVREASVLGDSLQQMASAMNQLTKVFDGSIDPANEKSDEVNHKRHVGESMELDPIGRPSDDEVMVNQTNPKRGVNFANSNDTVKVQSTFITISSDTDIGLVSAGEITVDEDPRVTTRSSAVEESPELQLVTEVQAVPALSTRSATRALKVARSAAQLTETTSTANQPVIESSSQIIPTSPSDKENATPMLELGTGASPLSEDMTPPAKKVKSIYKRGPGRPPRKSAAELDQLAKEAMERETRLSARQSRSRMGFDSRYSL